ncbi:MAG: hypothetical protein ACTSPY_09665 [Candidatus Helarchaeota archaeon]
MSENKNEKPLDELKKESKGKGGSWLYGFILMAGGIMMLILGMVDLMGYNFIYNYLVSVGYSDIASSLPVAGVMNFVVGVFAIIAGYGLIIDQEWAWGIAMFILVYATIQSIVYIIQNYLSYLTSPSLLLAQTMFWVSIVIVIVAIAGLIYLGLTKYKYA